MTGCGEMMFFHIPKIELHAHLSGSLSDDVLEKLLKQSHHCLPKETVPYMQSTLKLGNKRSLTDCFEVFKLIHTLTNNIEAIKMMTYDVIKEFHEDNVWYLELRTTPKLVPGTYTKQQYLEGVLESLIKAEKNMKILVRLLISLDRGRGIDDAWDTLNLTRTFLRHELYGKYVCGIDISGNPNAGSLTDYLPIFREAKALGLKLAVHLLEVNTATAFDEANQVLKEGLVDRIGHATFLHPLTGGSRTLTNIVKERKIPIEVCISSNLKCGSVKSLGTHHVKIWKEEKHPIAVCTDDKGVFSTTLSQELSLYDQIIGGSLDDVKFMALSSLQASFLEENMKENVLRELSSFMTDLKS